MATNYTFRVEGMHCGSCALLIDDVLHDLPGVRDAHTSATKHQTTVELDTTHTSPDDVISAIAEAGYRAARLE